MKRLICTVLAAASLGGCVVVPAYPGGYGHHHRYADAPVMVVPPGRGYAPPVRPGYGWDGGRGGDYGRRW